MSEGLLPDTESDAASEGSFQLTINEHYAKAFQYKKEREELEELKLKYGSDAEESEEDSETDSEGAESEDEDGEELTPAVDAAILRTLARIKRKDPEIYDSKLDIFEEEQNKLGSAKPATRAPKDQSKPVTVRQIALEARLDTGSRSPEPEPLTHVEEQQRLREETIAAFHQQDVNGDGDDDFLILREKTKDEQEKEEEEYRAFLEREVGGDLRELVTVDAEAALWKDDGDIAHEASDKEKEKKSKEKKKGKNKSKSKEEEDQDFLVNYILNRGWIDRSTKHIPTYNEVTSSKSKRKKKAEQEDDEDSEDASADENAFSTADDEDDFDEIVDRFESSYNFRFEEPDADVIKTYPRNLPSLVRREDTTRKEARERKKKRKEEELQKKREEVKRLKALKMKELRVKLDRIGKEGGKAIQNDPALQDLDLEGDWDAEAHDRQMAGLFGDDAEYEEDGKPTWDDDIDIGDIVGNDDEPSPQKKKKKKKKKAEEAADEDGVDVDAMDADVEKVVDDEEWDGTEEMRKRKLDEYMDEIYGLDFNDMVGGMPTRFRYTQVEPQDFALTPVEILMATDKELNEYMGIKKFAPYRKQSKWDPKRGEKLKELKAKIGERGYGNEISSHDERPAKKRKGKKERMKMKILAEPEAEGTDDEKSVQAEAKKTDTGLKRRHHDDDVDDGGEGDEKPGKKKRRRHRKKGDNEVAADVQ